ncbi:T6SS phospholipase effector Tle1-like catalytic domain-containing protein [Marinobacterium lutimaris]|uniref:Uncharacterized alpha/beta hydrolase domain n=1 Tax=Marinobacterium lutimaris TaxID=568106 RepID=A0A1H5Y2N7_9GAMM|nr:DUF2235 domain-containing protein [Marinobacterium lutimaris]SEG18168.1 Uncharacterized alpha/beta hydrolase domain [Marinobacterium lutimaris]
MSSTLASPLQQRHANPSAKNDFFLPSEISDLDSFEESREINSTPLSPCDTNLFFGFFFDGTGNNYEDSINQGDHSQSNVARLYSAYPGLSVPGILPPQTDWQTNLSDYDNFFRIYIPGVGTRFTQLGDTGEGFWDETLGGGMARWGQVRILWALAQAINAVSRYFLKQSVIDHETVRRASLAGEMNARALKGDPFVPLTAANSAEQISLSIPKTLVRWLRTLHTAIAPHMAGSEGGLPQNKDPGIVKRIYMSAFGFSRGATEARAFANWLIKLCEIDAQLTGRSGAGLTLAGFPVTFDYLGLFDTVASVGIANLIPIADGHAAWGDAETSLAIPANVSRCLHLVSAHENRRSFPLDSIYNDRSMPGNGEEIVFPGVHSDIGGGYRPGSQGKGTDNIGRDMLSKIPLAVMYRDARLSGVPLKLELALPDDQDAFKISTRTISDFNAYLDTCHLKSGDTGTLMREHWRKGIEWRLNNHRNGGVSILSSYQRAPQYQKNNLASSYNQFRDELERFENWQALKRAGFFERAALLLKDYMVMGPGWIVNRINQSPSLLDPSVVDDWERIEEFSDELSTPPAAVETMMDEYVHDSIAGFLIKWLTRDEVITYLNTLVAKKTIIDNSRFWQSRNGVYLSPEEREFAEYYERTGRIPPMGELGGRESYLLGGGYLRFRRVYAGADDQILALLSPDAHREDIRLALIRSAESELKAG